MVAGIGICLNRSEKLILPMSTSEGMTVWAAGIGETM